RQAPVAIEQAARQGTSEEPLEEIPAPFGPCQRAQKAGDRHVVRGAMIDDVMPDRPRHEPANPESQVAQRPEPLRQAVDVLVDSVGRLVVVRLSPLDRDSLGRLREKHQMTAGPKDAIHLSVEGGEIVRVMQTGAREDDVRPPARERNVVEIGANPLEENAVLPKEEIGGLEAEGLLRHYVDGHDLRRAPDRGEVARGPGAPGPEVHDSLPFEAEVVENLKKVGRDLEPMLMRVVGKGRHDGHELVRQRAGQFRPAVDLPAQPLVLGIQEVRNALVDPELAPAGAPEGSLADLFLVLALHGDGEIAASALAAPQAASEAGFQIGLRTRNRSISGASGAGGGRGSAESVFAVRLRQRGSRRVVPGSGGTGSRNRLWPVPRAAPRRASCFPARDPLRKLGEEAEGPPPRPRTSRPGGCG